MAALPLIILPQLLLTNVTTGLKAKDGCLGSLVLLVHGSAERDGWEWVLETASLLTYSRPAVSLLTRTPADAPHSGWIMPIDWLHLGLLLILSATGLAIAFKVRERRVGQ